MGNFNTSPRLKDSDFKQQKPSTTEEPLFSRRNMGLVLGGAVSGVLVSCMGVENIPLIRELRRLATSKMYRIRHSLDTGRIADEAKELLHHIAQILAEDQNARIEVYGGYGNKFMDDSKKHIAEDRTAVITSYLVEHGAKLKQIIPGRRGHTEPLKDFSEIVLYYD